MSVPVRLAAFASVLGLLLLAGLGIGRVVGPVGASTPAETHGSAAPHGETDSHGGTESHGETGSHGQEPTGVTGLAVSEDGYTLRPATTTLPVGTSAFRFPV